MELLHRQESERVIGLVFDVRNKMGGGWSEEIYHWALYQSLLENDIPTLFKSHKPLVHRGTMIYTFEPDLIVWDKVVLELKVLPKFRGKRFPPINEAQTIHYLKHFKKDLGILVNFAHAKVGLKRIVYQPPAMNKDEDYERIKSCLDEQDKVVLREIRHHILGLANHYGTGYPEVVYRKMVALELEHQGIKCLSDIAVPAKWQDKLIGTQATQHLLVEDRILLLVRANMTEPSVFDYLKTRTFLKALGLKIGLVINFGRNILHIHGTAV